MAAGRTTWSFLNLRCRFETYVVASKPLWSVLNLHGRSSLLAALFSRRDVQNDEKNGAIFGRTLRRDQVTKLFLFITA